MKNNIFLFFTLASLLIATPNQIFAQDPAVTGAAFDEDPLEATQTTALRISFANTSSGSIPNASIEVTVAFPSNWYGTDGVTPPIGQGAAFFNWVYLTTDVWRGTNNAVIPGFSGGEIAFTVTGFNPTGGNTETTNINVQVVDNFGDFNDNTANNNLSPVLEIIDAPLPIDLLDFQGKLNDNKVDLFWKTASEENNDYFLVERSANGTNFTKLGSVDGKGNTALTSRYTFTDEQVLQLDAKTLYYRLKQVDFDGSFTYSNIISVALERGDGLNFFPNPTSGLLYFNNVDDIAHLKIYNALGKLLISGSAEAVFKANKLDVSDLEKGVLYLNIQMKEGTVINEKILLSR